MKLHHYIFNNQGISLIQVLVGFGLASILSLVVSTVVTQMRSEMKSLEAKQNLFEKKNEIVTLLSLDNSCCLIADTAIGDLQIDEDNVSNPINVKKIFTSCSGTATALSIGDLDNSNSYRVKDMKLNISTGAGNNYAGNLVIDYEQATNTVIKPRPVILSLSLLTSNNPTNPAQKIISSCKYGPSSTNLNQNSQRQILFGGMWGLPSTIYRNPYTDSTSCPNGYNQIEILGQINMDYTVVLCFRDTLLDSFSEMPSEYFAFGGMYSADSTYVNPYTGGKSCPTGYTTHQVLGYPNVDHNLYFCGKRLYSNLPDESEMFSGIHTYKASNPATLSQGCPTGYSSTAVHGRTNLDHTVNICYKTP